MSALDFTSRIQSYVNFSTVAEAAASRRFDITQIKYDGWWARLVVTGGIAQIYSRQGQLKETRPVPGIADMVLIGEFLKGTNRACAGDSGKVMVFDALFLPGTGTGITQVFDYSYSARERFIRNLKSEGRLPDWVVPVESFSPTKSVALWEEHVMNGGGEGLVYRSSREVYHPATIGRVKRVFTMDYVVMGFTESTTGKRKGMAGNLICGLYVNGVLTEKVKVGGGFNNPEMIDQFQNFGKYKGRVLEVKGWQLFESGAMRHPNACRNDDGSIRWRDDKRPEDCVWSV